MDIQEDKEDKVLIVEDFADFDPNGCFETQHDEGVRHVFEMLTSIPSNEFDELCDYMNS